MYATWTIQCAFPELVGRRYRSRHPCHGATRCVQALRYGVAEPVAAAGRRVTGGAVVGPEDHPEGRDSMTATCYPALYHTQNSNIKVQALGAWMQSTNLT